MATVPPGPSSALSPAQSPPFPGAGSAEPATGTGDPACHREDRVPSDTGKKCEPVVEVKTSVQKKQKNMLARASPAALHLKIQAREQQQLNGLASPTEDADNPAPSTDNCDSCSSGSTEEAPGVRNNSEQGHILFPENGSLSPRVNNSVNGMPGFTRTEGKEEFLHEPTEGAGPRGEESPAAPPPVAQLARLNLSGSPEENNHGIRYVRYESELQMPWIMRLITKDLSEPYSIYTYRYFIHNWPQLCFLVSLT